MGDVFFVSAGMTTEMVGADQEQDNEDVPEMNHPTSIFTPEMVAAVSHDLFYAM